MIGSTMTTALVSIVSLARPRQACLCCDTPPPLGQDERLVGPHHAEREEDVDEDHDTAPSPRRSSTMRRMVTEGPVVPGSRLLVAR